MWGCLEEVLIPESKKRKFKLSDFTRLSLLKNNVALRFLVLKHDINNFDDNTIIESKTTKFIENVFPTLLCRFFFLCLHNIDSPDSTILRT